MGHQLIYLGKVPNYWTDRNKIWHTYRFISDMLQKLTPRTQGAFGGGQGVTNSKMCKRCQTAVPIGTKFGTRMHIHLGMDMIYKLTPRYPTGMGVDMVINNSYIWENFQTTGPIGTKFSTRMQIHLGMDIG